jgi:hypothetical protein
MRLLLPGYEGNMNIKYLRRIKLRGTRCREDYDQN